MSFPVRNSMKVLRALSAICLLCVLASKGRAQTCPGLHQAAAESGDSSFNFAIATPSLSTLITSSSTRNGYFVTPWGLNGCSTVNENEWKVRNGGFGPCLTTNATYSDPECASRRLLNAAFLLEQVPHPTAGTYRQYMGVNSSKMSFHPASCNSEMAYADTGYYCGSSWGPYVEVRNRAIFATDLFERAGVLAHEAAHPGTGKGHCTSSSCVCPFADSCDESYPWGGAFAKHFDFLEAMLNREGLITSPFFRASTHAIANNLLNERFAQHPGFNLRTNDFDTTQERRPWDVFLAGPIDLAFYPDPDGPTRLFAGLGLASGWAPQGSTVGRIDHCTVAIESYPFENTRSARRIHCLRLENLFGTGSPITPSVQRKVFDQLPELSGTWPLPAMTSLKLKAASNRAVEFLQGTRRTVSVGMATGHADPRSDPDSGAPSNWDLQFDAPSGLFISGLGLGMAKSGTPRLNAAALNLSLGPDYETRVGGQGGSMFRMRCDSGYVPIGTRQLAATSSFGPVVGYFGVVCAPPSRLQSADDPSLRRIARTSFVDPNTQVWYQAGIYPISVAQPTGVVEVLCPVGSMIRGITTRSGVVVDRIVEILCTNGNSFPVNVGGTGGTLNTNDCWWPPGPAAPHTRTYINSFYSRSGHLLDALAPSCKSPMDFLFTFEEKLSVDDDILPSWIQFGDEIGVPPAFVPGFVIQDGPSPNRNAGTGPAGGNPGKYGLLNSAANSKASMVRRTLDLRDVPSVSGAKTFLQFDYHIRGPTVSSSHKIEVWTRLSSAEPGTMSRHTLVTSGSQGDSWLTSAPVDLTNHHGEVIDVQIVASRDVQGQSDVAIDNLRIWTQP